MTDESQQEDPKDDIEFTVDTVSVEMQKIATLACSRCSELRSVTVIFDWEGVINMNSDVPMGIWADEVGPIRPADIDTIRGSIGQTLKMMASQASMAMESMSILEGHLGELNQELRKLEKYVDIEKGKAEEAQPGDNDSGDA